MLFRIGLFVVIFFNFIFASNKNVRDVFPGGDCKSVAVIVCARMVGGVPIYTPVPIVYPNLPNIDFADVERGLYLVTVDITGWDLTTSSYKSAFNVKAFKGKRYKLTDNFYMLESIGNLDFTQDAEYFVKNDPIRDYRSSSYLLFENYGLITQTRGDFVNLGVSIIGEGGEYYYTPGGLDNCFYSEVLQIGGTGGSTTQFSAESNNFAFIELSIENAVFELHNTENVLITGVNREINLYGNVVMGFFDVKIENSDFAGSIDLYAENDNNNITMENSQLKWNNYGFYVPGEGPSLHFSCSAYCSQNSISLNQSELYINAFSLQGVAEFHVTLENNSTYSVESLSLENSNLVYDISNSNYESFLSIAYLYAGIDRGIIEVDANSTMVINIYNSSKATFHTPDFVGGGSVTLNLSDNSKVSFWNITRITDTNIYLNLSDDTTVEFDKINMYGGEIYMNLSKNSRLKFLLEVEVSGGSFYLDLIDDSFTSFSRNLKIDSSDIYVIASDDSSIMFYNDVEFSGGNFSMELSEHSYSYFEKNISLSNEYVNISMSELSILAFVSDINIFGSEVYIDMVGDSKTFSHANIELVNSDIYMNFDEQTIFISDKNFNITNGGFYVDLREDAAITFSEKVTIVSSEISIVINENTQIQFHSGFNISGTEGNIDINDNAKIIFFDAIEGNDGKLNVNVKNNGFVYFSQNTDIKDAQLTVNQEAYIGGTEQTLLRFNNVNTFLDDDFIYNYSIVSRITIRDFDVRSSIGTGVILLQIRNYGASGAFPYEAEVSKKITDVGGESFSVLITYAGGLIDYIDIGGTEYAEFGVNQFIFHRAQDQYGEDEGLLTLTTLENMDGYGVAVAFDNIMLSTTDREPYRVTLFNVVITHSHTVEELGQTLNSLDANITPSNLLFGSSVMELIDKSNTLTLLENQSFNLSTGMRELSNDTFRGNFLVFGISRAFYYGTEDEYKFGGSAFFAPYNTQTAYDLDETNNSIVASLFWAIKIGDAGGAIMFNVSIMQSSINGTALGFLAGENTRKYNYDNNSTSATISYSFGEFFNQRILVSAFATGSQSYLENPSDLALEVTTPAYSNMFVGYYSKLFNAEQFSLEVGVKYYFKESQTEGQAGFVNDKAGQIWSYQYLLLDTAVEINLEASYKMSRFLGGKLMFNKRGNYNNFGFYIMYQVQVEADGYVSDF